MASIREGIRAKGPNAGRNEEQHKKDTLLPQGQGAAFPGIGRDEALFQPKPVLLKYFSKTGH